MAIKDNNYKALNIRVKKDHINKEAQTRMIGLFKHQAYEQGLTQAEYFAHFINKVYQLRKYINESIDNPTIDPEYKKALMNVYTSLPRMVEEPIVTKHEPQTQSETHQEAWDDIFALESK